MEYSRHGHPIDQGCHLKQHHTLKTLVELALDGKSKECKEIIEVLPEYQKDATIYMIKETVREQGKELDLS